MNTHRLVFSSLAIFAATTAFHQVAHAQGLTTDYVRAERLQALTQGKVIGGAVKANWAASAGDRFWYRADRSSGKREFLVVDAVTATRMPAFDHAKMASALGTALGRTLDAERLPVDSLTLSGDGGVPAGSIRVQAAGRAFLCDLATYTLKPDPAGLTQLRGFEPDAGPHASQTTGADTTINFVNRMGVPVDLVWLDPDGHHTTYGTLAPEAEREMHTYAGHVWLATAHGGDGAPIIKFVAGEGGGTAIVQKPGAGGGVRPPTDRRRRARQNNANPALSPDGKWEVAIHDSNVYLRDRTVNNAETALTKDGLESNAYQWPPAWSPDGKKLVVYKVIPAQEHKVYMVESTPRDQKQPKLHTIDYLKPGDRVAVARPHLFDMTTHTDIPIATDLFANPYDVGDAHWAADSSRFFFTYNQRGHQVLRVVGVDAGTGEAHAIVDDTSKTFIDYSGKQFEEYEDATNEIVWMSERDGWNHLYLYDSKAGTLKNQITKGQWVVRGVDRVDPVARQIWFRAGGVVPGMDPYYIQYGRVNFDGTGLTWLTQADGTHTVSYSPDSKFYVDTYSRVDQPSVSELHRVSDGKLLLPLEKADDAPLLATGWKAPERFVAKARDGVTDIYGVIYRPTNFDPTRHYPVIEDIYAGPQDSYVPKAFGTFYGPQELAEIGFITVQIDGMGTSNRSKAFHDVCWKNLGDAGFPDRILWLQAAAKKYPYMDLAHVGIYGVSAGGQDAARAPMTHGDFYKAAVADSGCHDNQMDKIWWNEQWMGWPVDASYDASSNVVAAKNLSGKLMLIVGELDTNVDPASTYQVVDALIHANKDFDLLVVPGGGHGAGESPYGRRRRADFFVRNLLGVEPRRDAGGGSVATATTR